MCPKCNKRLTEQNYCFGCELQWDSDNVIEETSDEIFEPIDWHIFRLSKTGDLSEAFRKL